MLLFVFGITWYLGRFSVHEARFANQLDLQLYPGQILELDLTGVELEVVAIDPEADPEAQSSASFETIATGRGEDAAEDLAASEPVWSPRATGGQIKWKAELDDLALARGTGRDRLGRLKLEIPPGVDVRVVSTLGCHFSGDFGDANLACQTEEGSATINGKARSLQFDALIGEIEVLLDGYVGWVNTSNSRGDTLLVGSIGELEARSGSGAIRAQLETPPISANLVSKEGEIVASGLAGKVRAQSETGMVRLALYTLESDDSVVITTESGNIELFLAPEVEAELSAISELGTVKAAGIKKSMLGEEFKIEPRSPSAAEVTIRSRSGAVNLLAQDTIDPLVEPSLAAEGTPASKLDSRPGGSH